MSKFKNCRPETYSWEASDLYFAMKNMFSCEFCKIFKNSFFHETSHQYVFTTSQASVEWNTQRRLSGTLQGRLSGTYKILLLVLLYDLSCKSQIKHPKRCCGTSPPILGVTFSRRLRSRSLLHIQLCHNLHLVGF